VPMMPTLISGAWAAGTVAHSHVNATTVTMLIFFMVNADIRIS